MAYRYAKEKLARIVYVLATGEGDVRARLKRAYRDIRILEESDVPEDMREDLSAIKKWMVRYGVLRNRWGMVANALDHTMRRSRNSTAKQIAERLYSMKSQLRRK